MINQENVIFDNEKNIIDCIINCFLNIKELRDIFLSLNDNEIKNLSSISLEYYNLLRNQGNNFLKIENEIKKQQILYNRSIFENVIESFISTLNNTYLFTLEKLLIEKCIKCQFKKPPKILKSNYHSIVIKKRVINETDNVSLEKLFESSEVFDICRKCKEKKYLLKSDYIYLPQILIIILIYDKNFKNRINYPTKEFNIKGCIKKNDVNDELEEKIFKYHLKILIYRDEKNNYKNCIFSNDNNYINCQNINNDLKSPIVLFYKRSRIDDLDKIYEIKYRKNNENIKKYNNNDNNNKDLTLFNDLIKRNKIKNQKGINDINLIKNENINDKIKNISQNNPVNIIKGKENNINNNDINNFNNIENNFNNMKNQNINNFIRGNNDFKNINNNIQLNNNMMNNNIFNGQNYLINNYNLNNMNNFNCNFPNNGFNNNFNNNIFINNNFMMNNNVNNIMNNNNNFNNINNFNNNINMNNINNKNITNNNNQINNNNNNNFNNNNNNSPQTNEKKILCLLFVFKEYKKEIYIDINEEDTFKKAIEELHYKYSWLYNLKTLKYSFNGNEIKDHDKKIKEIGLNDLSQIDINISGK